MTRSPFYIALAASHWQRPTVMPSKIVPEFSSGDLRCRSRYGQACPAADEQVLWRAAPLIFRIMMDEHGVYIRRGSNCLRQWSSGGSNQAAPMEPMALVLLTWHVPPCGRTSRHTKFGYLWQ